jgi:hypothetical protein
MVKEKKKAEQKKEGPDTLNHGFDLIDAVSEGQDITVRDDQYDYYWIEDAAKMCRKKGRRFRLLDTGKFEKIDLMWLIDSGLDFYTDDKAGRDFTELEELAIECKRGNSSFAYLQTEEFGGDADSESLIFSGLKTMARTGVFLYVTSKGVKTELDCLKDLAESCREGGTRLVYYHHGELDPIFVEIANYGVWIHISEKSINKEQRLLLLEIARSAGLRGGGLIVHLENPVEYDLVKELMGAGAYIIFLYAQFDYRSPFRKLENQARQKKCHFRAYYLQHDYFL